MLEKADREIGLDSVMVNFTCQLDSLKDAQMVSKTVFLGASVKVFLEDLSI